jgi:hypothetical protein
MNSTLLVGSHLACANVFEHKRPPATKAAVLMKIDRWVFKIYSLVSYSTPEYPNRMLGNLSSRNYP